MGWADDNDQAEADGLAFASVQDWFDHWLSVHYTRSLDGGSRAWCPEWHQHPEAVSRLTGLWLAWEALDHNKGAGLASWWVNLADPTMAVLLSPDGPFARCSRGHGDRQPGPLPWDDPQQRQDHCGSAPDLSG